MFRARALLLPALVVVAAQACTCDPTQVASSSGKLVIEPQGVDFGTGCLDDTLEREILLTNIGNAELEIFGITHTGGEAFTLFDELPQYLASNESFVLHVGLTPTEAIDYAGTITISTSDEEDTEQSITLVGKGFDGEKYDLQVSCEYEPGSGEYDKEFCLSLEFDNVLAGTTAERKFLLENRGCGVVNVNEFYFYPDPIVYDDPNAPEALADVALFSSPELAAPFELRGLTKQEVTLAYSPTATGVPSVRLKLRSTDPEIKNASWEPGEWDLAMFANSVAPALLVDPEIVTFFEATAGAPLEKTVTVRNTGSAPLTIDKLELVGEGGTTDFTLAPGNEAPFTLASTGTAGDERAVGVIYTSSGPGSDKAKLVVGAGQDIAEVSLLGGTQPLLAVRWVDPDTLDERIDAVNFGATAAGQTDIERTVRLFNEGQAPLNVTAIEIVENAAGGFTLPDTVPTGSIAPGASVEFTIHFDDQVSMRNDSAKLQITSNDPVDAAVGGIRRLDIVSTNEPNFMPIPNIDVCAKLTEASTNCSTQAGPGNVVLLDASASVGGPPPEDFNDTVTFEWEFRTKPADSKARIECTAGAVPECSTARIVTDTGSTIDVAGNYVVRVWVTDQYGNRADANEQIRVSGN